MQTLDNKKFNCTGCGACANVCPKNAIQIIMNDEGFYQYKIDRDKCINCGLCLKTCPKNNFKNSNKKSVDCFAAYSCDKDIVRNSSSGGIFSELAIYIIDNGGYVAGVVNNNNNPIHILTNDKGKIEEMRGSKYLQSNTNHIYKEIKKVIDTSKVLFCGTPCQCAAIKQIINNENLIVLDIVCHGVPSKKVFSKSLSDRFDAKINRTNFRNKTSGWINYCIQYFSNDREIKTYKFLKDEWFSGYLKNLFLMESCYSCEFNSLPRVGDITLGDCWGIEYNDRDFFKLNANKGVSLVLINNKKGKDLFSKIMPNINCKTQDLGKYVRFNSRISSGIYPNAMVEKRNEFFRKDLEGSFKKHRYSISNTDYILKSCKEIVKKILRR